MTETPSARASSQSAPTGDAERPAEYIADVSFASLNLSPELMKAIAERGYVSPTPVQARAWPPVMAGKDLIVRSKTGTGKTAAFGMPIIDRIPMGTREVKALCLCPTRELAMQVSQELESLAKYRDIKVTAIYGGASMKVQEDALDYGSAIIVGTPGRVYDHIRRGNLKLGKCAYAVLDEADEMLNQGFYEEVTRILDYLPKGRQVLLFSATVPEDIQRLIARYTTDAETLLLSGDVYTVDHIKHIRYELSDAFPKPRNLLYMLEIEEPDAAIIFCNTKSDTELVTVVLNRAGFDAELLNGDLAQKERERVMAKVKRGEVAYMVATDLAARGIDISDLSHVVNYSLPEDPAVYLHRVGRTGRIGRKGTALNLTSGRELSTLTTLEKKYGIKFEKKLMPNPEEAQSMWTERHVRELKDASAGSVFEGYLSLAASLKQRPDADDLIAFMLKSFFAHRRMDRAREPGEETTAEALADRAERPEREARGGRRDARPRREDRGPREDRPRREDRGPREDRPRSESQPRIEVAAPPAPAHAQVTAPGVPSVAANIHTAETSPGGSAAVEKSASHVSDRELYQQMQKQQATHTPSGMPVSAAPAAPAGPQKKRLSDRERYEALMRGDPLPPVAEPDESIPPGTVEAREPREGRGRFDRDRGERGERGRGRDRDRGTPHGGREERPRREERPHHAEAAPAVDPNASDAALLKTLHQGGPLPEIADPTTRDAASSEEGDRSGRRRRREPEQLHPLAEGETRLWLNLGRADGVSESTMASALEAAGAPTGKLKRTELRGTFSYLVVAEGDVDSFVGLAGKPHGEKPLKVERAKR